MFKTTLEKVGFIPAQVVQDRVAFHKWSAAWRNEKWQGLW